jgi:hypothetical protein
MAIVKGRAKMGDLVAMVQEEWKLESKLETKTAVAKNLLEDGVPRKKILYYLQVTEVWLREVEKSLPNN